jgi:hypothetical protein
MHKRNVFIKAQFAAESSALTQDESNKELAIIIAANAKKLAAGKRFHAG